MIGVASKPPSLPSDEIVNVEVGLLLSAVPEHAQGRGVVEQSPDEVEDHAVGRSRSDDVGKPKNPRLDVVSV